MMNDIFISSIEIHNVRHLHDVCIDVAKDGLFRHLILTGPNGSGKTSLLEALLKYLELLAKDNRLEHLTFKDHKAQFQNQLANATAAGNEPLRRQMAESLSYVEQQIKNWWEQLNVVFHNEELVSREYAERKFIIAYYAASRKSSFTAPKNPQKPNLSFSIRDNKVDQFLYFLVDLKVQQALARNEGNQAYAEEIGKWFDDFLCLMRRIFHDEALTIEFNFKTYEFMIATEGKSFPFTALSDGYSAALDIVADLILKMQNSDHPVRAYEMPGIVLIDEIETHLHLALQKEILPILTSVFPRIQFVVSSHSPFVINSVPNVTVFDLKSCERVENLTDYSYEALAEGVFGVDMASGELSRRLRRLDELAERATLSDVEREEARRMAEDFSRVPDALAPSQKMRFKMLMVKFQSKGLL